MFDIPDLKTLASRAAAAFRAHLPGVDALAPGNNITPTAKVLAGEMWALFGRLAWVMRQAFVLHAEGEWLKRHASQYGMSRRPSANAVGSVSLAYADGVSVEAGALFAAADGRRYVAPYAVSALGSGDIAVTVEAMAPGAAGNIVQGEPLEIVSGVAGASSASVAAGGVVGGDDVEGDESLRARILFRLRYPPHGGSAADYVRWAMSTPGVTRVFVDRLWQGPGTVRVVPMFDGLRAGGIATASDIASVIATLAPLQPAAAGVTVSAATAHPIDITVSGLSPDTTEMRSAVVAAFDAAILTKGRVAGSDAGADGGDFLATPFSFSRSWLWEAAASATGERRHEIVAPSGDIAIPAGSVPTRGVVTFV